MKVTYTKHVLEKIAILKLLGWSITKKQIENTINDPFWIGAFKHGDETAMSLIKKTHILRVIFNRENDRIKVITVHIARRGRYESTL